MMTAYASVTSNHGPVRFLSPVRFLARKAEWSARRNFTVGAILVVTLGYGPRTIWHYCTLMVWSNNSQYSMGTPCGARTVPARKSSMFFISYGTRTGPVRDPQRCRTAALRRRKGIDTTRIGKTPARASYLAVRGPYGPLTGPAGAVRGLFTISKPVRGP